jgi:hypothetical protein
MSTLVRTGITLQATRPVISLGTPGLAAHNTLSGRSTASAHPTSAITGLDAALAALQPLDADLTAIAALTTTSFGRGVLTQADAPALATYAGLAGLATSGISGALTLAKAGTTARTITFPDAAITVASLSTAQSFTALQTFTSGLTVSAGTTALQAVTCTTLAATASPISISLTAGSPRDIMWLTAGVSRWIARCSGDLETGADAGSNWQLYARTDAGSALDIPIAVARAAGGAITFTRPLTAAAISCTTLTASGSGALGATALLGSERLRVAGGTMGTPGVTDVLVAGGAIKCGATTASDSTATGALTVAGGVGVAGRVSATEFASGTTKVLGAQGAAVADATDAASAITQLNALLARCRAHGLIA